MEDETFRLPEVHTGRFGEEQLALYFEELRDSATLLEARIKQGSTGYSEGGGETFDACAEVWRASGVLLMQLIYAHEGVVWCDTLRRVSDGAQLVRIQRQG